MKTRHLMYSILSLGVLLTGCSEDTSNDETNNLAALQADVETLTEHAEAGPWVITNFVDSGENETADFTGYGFSFNPDGSLVAENGTNTVNGSWSITIDDDSSDDMDGSSDDSSMDDDCDNCTVDFLSEVLGACSDWYVDKLEIGENEFEDDFINHDFNFSSDGSVAVTVASETYMGTWMAEGEGNGITVNLSFPDFADLNASWTLHEIDLYQGESYVDLRIGDNRLRFKNGCTLGDFQGGSSTGEIDFNIFFASPANFAELTEDWNVVSYSATKIELIHVSGGDGETDLLTFEKN